MNERQLTIFDLEEELLIDKRVDEFEESGILTRWEFGKVMLGRRVGKQLPNGYLDQLCDETGKGRWELQMRARFAERYPTEVEVCDAITHFRSWWQITHNLGDGDERDPHVSNNSGNNEWYTPADLINAARAAMGGIDLDPASSAEANQTVGATTFYTAKDNGLTQRWFGTVWMNPPYAQPLVDQFCDRITQQYALSNITAACVLVNNATETGWFQTVITEASAICFPKGRIRFWQPNKNSAAPLQGQAIIYLGPEASSFAREFEQFGFITEVTR